MINIAVLTGEDASIWIGSTTPQTQTIYGISDFSLNFNRGTVEQPLIGQKGNYFMQGSLSIDGSLTNCKFGASGNSDFLDSLIVGTVIQLSGQVDASSSLKFTFASAQVTGYDVSFGDASTITEASIDFTIMNPKDASYASQKVTV